MSKTAVLILAAGASKRIGKPKQLLPYKESNLFLLEKSSNFNPVEKFKFLWFWEHILKKSCLC